MALIRNEKCTISTAEALENNSGIFYQSKPKNLRKVVHTGEGSENLAHHKHLPFLRVSQQSAPAPSSGTATCFPGTLSRPADFRPHGSSSAHALPLQEAAKVRNVFLCSRLHLPYKLLSSDLSTPTVFYLKACNYISTALRTKP